MALVRRQNIRTRPTQAWNLAAMSDLLGDVDSLFGAVTTPLYNQTSHAYPVDLFETDDALVLEMAVPGVAVEHLDISLEGRQLSIKGDVPEAEDEGRRYWLRTISQGQFSRTVTLPVEVDADKVAASASNGVLSVTLPKVAEAKARKITVNN